MNITAVLAFIAAASATVLGLVALIRKPRTIAQVAFAIGLAALAFQAVFYGLAFSASDPDHLRRYTTWSVLAGAAIPGPWILFSLTYSRGNWRAFVQRWRVLLIAAFTVPAGIVLLFRERCVLGLRDGSQPESWFLALGWPGSVLVLATLLGCIFVLMNVERTFRASVGTMRWRIKYMVLGLAVLFGVQVYTSGQALLYSGTMSGIASIKVVAIIVGCGLMGLAVARAGLLDVDIYPSQSIIQHSITIVIAGLYLFVIGVLAKVLRAVAGDSSFSLNSFLVLIALVGLAVIVFSERLREQTRRWVSRHFQRPHYDYRQVWSTFTIRTASLIKADELCRAAAQWLSENVRVLSVTIWLVDEAKNQLAFGASTTIPEEKALRLLQLDAKSAALIPSIRGKPAPFDVDASGEPWLDTLKRAQPDAFESSGNRICAPIIAGKELLGFIILGDRVNAVPVSREDLELLSCIANQLAGRLLNIRLSAHLLQVREMEAFQTISAFFVHDLKNTASALSLMLQNLPAHFDDPEFRKDALRGLGKSVERINELIARLTLLRQEMALNPKEVDLNDVVGAAVNGLNGVSQVTIDRAFASDLPRIRFDPDKIQKVITNVLTNAVEAVGENGRIQVGTGAQNGWVSVSIADNGCGMTPEFINHSLFRPFQTTKKKGIGIGMFLSKIVVEAHQGKIEVDSKAGKGTTFRVLLPIQKEAV